MKRSYERNLNHIMRFALLFGFSTMGFSAYGQNCDYSTGTISFSATGGNNTENYTTRYVLTNQQGTIVSIFSETEIDILTEGFYSIYPVNYKNSDLPDNLVVDENILNVTGGCLNIGAPYSFTVCEEIDNCNYCFGEDVTLNATGGNTEPGFVTQYFLTNNAGEILVIQDNPDFEDLEVGSYVAFALNYDPAKTLLGFEIGSNVTDIEGGCKEISDGLIIGVCEALDPTIFFDLKGCDITQTALLQVGEVYDSYLWSTGATSDFIVVDANAPATYRVTVSLASGCQGVAIQPITGKEISTIGDFVFEDVNGDGIQDGGDRGMNGVTVNLYADFNRDGKPDFAGFPSCITTTTNHPDTGQPGYYIFHVYRSNYVVEFVAPPGFELTLPNEGDDDNDSDADENGFTGSIGVLSDEHLTNIDAGFTTSSGIGGYVWYDADGDGVRDDSENGFNDAVVNIYNANGTLVATTVSTVNPSDTTSGFYCFDGLTPGDYYTEIELPEGYVLSPPMATGNTSRDSDANGENGPNTTPVITVSPGEKRTAIDFGMYQGGVLCGIVWRDSIQGNASIFDPGTDMLLPNVQVSLISLDLDAVVELVNTDENGAYCFRDVGIGSYAIGFFGNSLPTFVTPNVGDNELFDSDVNPTTGRTPAFFVSPADTILGLNAGITQPALPVDLVSFEGRYDAARRVNVLTWVTATEINNDYFELQRASGSDGSFEAIGRIKGAGNSSGILTYDFDDTDVWSGLTYYYRLKQVDYDGNFEYSEIIAISISKEKSLDFSVFPNPARQILVVEMNAITPVKAKFRLTDISGRAVKEWSAFNLSKGISQVKLSIHNVDQGTYVLSISGGGEQSHRIVQVVR